MTLNERLAKCGVVFLTAAFVFVGHDRAASGQTAAFAADRVSSDVGNVGIAVDNHLPPLVIPAWRCPILNRSARW